MRNKRQHLLGNDSQSFQLTFYLNISRTKLHRFARSRLTFSILCNWNNYNKLTYIATKIQRYQSERFF